MSGLQIYGYAASRAVRTLWMCEELGLTYDHVPVAPAGGATRTPDFLKVNPAGHIPAIDDGGFKLSESLAINLYLARKHGKLMPASIEGEAKALQWSFWAASEFDLQMVQWFTHAVLLPMEQRNVAVALQAREAMEWPLTVLDRELADRTWLLPGDSFTVADLNVASVLYRLLFVDMTGKPNVERWLKACWQRPAARKARELREGKPA
jgi:glutathione S-transferase